VWLAGVLERGVRASELRLRGGAATDASRLMLGALQGAMLVARTYRSLERFDAVAARLLGDLVEDATAPVASKRGRRGKASRGSRAPAGARAS